MLLDFFLFSIFKTYHSLSHCHKNECFTDEEFRNAVKLTYMAIASNASGRALNP